MSEQEKARFATKSERKEWSPIIKEAYEQGIQSERNRILEIIDSGKESWKKAYHETGNSEWAKTCLSHIEECEDSSRFDF